MVCTSDEGLQHESQQHLQGEQRYGGRTVSVGIHGTVPDGQLRLEGEREGSGEARHVFDAQHVPRRWGVVVGHIQVSVDTGEQVPQHRKQQPVKQEGAAERQHHPSPPQRQPRPPHVPQGPEPRLSGAWGTALHQAPSVLADQPLTVRFDHQGGGGGLLVAGSACHGDGKLGSGWHLER